MSSSLYCDASHSSNSSSRCDLSLLCRSLLSLSFSLSFLLFSLSLQKEQNCNQSFADLLSLCFSLSFLLFSLSLQKEQKGDHSCAGPSSPSRSSCPSFSSLYPCKIEKNSNQSCADLSFNSASLCPSYTGRGNSLFLVAPCCSQGSTLQVTLQCHLSGGLSVHGRTP